MSVNMGTDRKFVFRDNNLEYTFLAFKIMMICRSRKNQGLNWHRFARNESKICNTFCPGTLAAEAFRSPEGAACRTYLSALLMPIFRARRRINENIPLGAPAWSETSVRGLRFRGGASAGLTPGVGTPVGGASLRSGSAGPGGPAPQGARRCGARPSPGARSAPQAAGWSESRRCGCFRCAW